MHTGFMRPEKLLLGSKAVDKTGVMPKRQQIRPTNKK